MSSAWSGGGKGAGLNANNSASKALALRGVQPASLLDCSTEHEQEVAAWFSGRTGCAAQGDGRREENREPRGVASGI